MKAIERVALRTGREGVVTGDFAGFYHSHYPRLVGSLVLYTGDREFAMDLAQEALARAYRDWKKVSGLESPVGWLHRVAFNLANSAFRRRLVERRFLARSAGSTQDMHHDPDAGEAVAVRRAVAKLPRRQKTALVLRYYADMSVAETAKAMDCAEGTVRALTSQALAALRTSGLAVGTEDET